MFFVIEQTNVCNFTCPSCPNRLRQRKRGYMKREMFEGITKDLLTYASWSREGRVALHGFGEPLISPGFLDNLECLEKNGFKNVDFSTNGSLLTKTLCTLLCKFECLTWVRVSVNSVNKELAERINEGTDFDEVVKNVHIFLDVVRERKPKFVVVLQIMKTKENESESVKEYRDFFGREDFDWKEVIYHDHLGQVARTNLNVSMSKRECSFGRDAVFIHWDGDIVGCCYDDTKSQVYWNVSKGVMSKEMIEERDKFNSWLKARDFSHLPLCNRCLSADS